MSEDTNTSVACWPSDACNFTIDDYKKRHEQLSAERDELRAKLARTEHEYQSAMNSIAIYDKTNGELRAKLDASERANADCKAFLHALRLKHDLDVPEEVWSALFSTDAGRDYVPKAEVEAARRQGMREAAMIARSFTESMSQRRVMETAAKIEAQILAACDAGKEGDD